MKWFKKVFVLLFVWAVVVGAVLYEKVLVTRVDAGTTTVGAVTETVVRYTGQSNDFTVITWDWTSSAGGAVTHTLPFDGQIVQVMFDPSSGSTSPTANYDITLNNSDSWDTLTALGSNLSQSITTVTVPSITATSEWPVYTFGTHTLSVTNAGAANVGQMKIWLKEI